MERINIGSGAPWEDLIGYSRAVRIGNLIEVTGTVAIENGNPFAPDDPYGQTIKILQIIEETLLKLNAQLSDIIRTRIYVTDIHTWKEVGRAHAEIFKDIRPATSLIEVSRLIAPDYLVEIEASAVVQ